MKIINPLYDKAFKYLMQNERISKKVLSVILNQEVLEVSLSQQETVVSDDKRGFTLFRLDFKAIIIDENGNKKKVLIELQKSKYSTDLTRFRAYLGANYLRTETEKNSEGVETSAIYPIITIYILGYNIKDIPYMAVSVNHKIVNSTTNQPIDINSEFINHLNHRSHILQVRRLPEERKSRLENFLTLFNQAWVTDKKYILDLQNISDDFKDIAKYLQAPVMNDEFRRQLEVEEEIDTVFDKQETKYLKQLKKAKLNEEKAKLNEEKAKLNEKKAKLNEKEKSYKLAKLLLKLNEPINKIITETGLSKEEINNLH